MRSRNSAFESCRFEQRPISTPHPPVIINLKLVDSASSSSDKEGTQGLVYCRIVHVKAPTAKREKRPRKIMYVESPPKYAPAPSPQSGVFTVYSLG